MAMQSTYDIGCDDLEDESGAIDICAHCAADNKFQPALYFCFDCGVFGRCMCGDCNKLHKKFAHKHVVRSLSSPAERTRRHSDSSKLQEEIDRLKGDLESITRQYNEAISDTKNKEIKVKEVEDQYKLYVKRSGNIKLENTSLQNEIKRLTTDLEDFKGKYNEAISDIKNKDKKTQEVERQYKLCVERSENLILENSRLKDEIHRLTQDFKGKYDDVLYRKMQTDETANKIEEQHKLLVKQTEELTKRNNNFEEENKRIEELPSTGASDIRSCYFGEDLELNTHIASHAAKIMKREVKNIIRKHKKRTSIYLNDCKTQYQTSLTELQNAVGKISSALEAQQTRESAKRNRAESERRATKSRPGFPESFNIQTNDTPSDECLRCRSKALKITEMEEQQKQSEENTRQVLASKDKLEEEYQRLKASTEKQVRRLEEQTAILKQQLQTERDMKDDAWRRLSAMASSKLRDNNPNITDLRDQNRPTKIAEKLSELYDNQWTDAFDALQKDGKQDKTIIHDLLGMLKDIFNECSRLAKDRFFEKVQDVIEFPVERKQSNRPVELPDQLKQQVKEFRRVRAIRIVKEVQEVVLQNLGFVNDSKDIQHYMAQCVEIGWLAAVQDPPLALMEKSNERYDTNMFKDYTQRGPYVEYVVWPALLLHENGPMLAKGVAQGCSIRPTISPQESNPLPPAPDSPTSP